MKSYFLSLSLLVLWSCGTQTSEDANQGNILKSDIQLLDAPQLIPQPAHLKTTLAYFEINATTRIHYPQELSAEGNYLKTLIAESSTFSVEEAPEDSLTPQIRLLLPTDFPDSLQNQEAYILEITDNGIDIEARSSTGIMRGIQTLRQLLPKEFHQNEKRDVWKFMGMQIVDQPAFQHRGLLLDVCRHFFDKEVVLKYIDALALYKMNVLHFHLTEDQGWRLPVDRYPLLNEISSWRTDSLGEQYGGFYSKEELKEIISYANERHVKVIPEIELPGHSQAALAAYPQFSCNGGPIEVVNDWGVFKEIYCAGNDSTFTFLEDILTEVMEIFPSEYIHIGGDEAPKFRWEHCAKCQKRMLEEGLADEHELQRYFIQRIERFLNANGRKLIGWDEILEGGLSENATVQSWRGMQGGINAARQRHQVIMSPTSHCYLDYGLHSIDLQKIYAFNPLPQELEEQYHSYILGGEGNMWTEHVPDETTLDQRVFPRLMGLAEVLWTSPKDRNFEAFYERLKHHYPLLSAFNIDYGNETIGAAIRQDLSGETIKIILEKNLPDLDLKYNWENKTKAQTYKEPIALEQNGTLIVKAYRNGKIYGDPIQQKFRYHKALNKAIDYQTDYNTWYEGNKEKNLCDGKIGSIDFRDGCWQGFWGEDILVTIDLGEFKEFSSINANFYQYANSWIFLPTEVSISYSEDNEKWSTIFNYSETRVDLSNEKSIHTIGFDDATKVHKARYIRFSAKNLGIVPEGHEAAGSEAWLFIDEITVN